MTELRYWTIAANNRRLAARARKGLKNVEQQLKENFYKTAGYVPVQVFRFISPDDEFSSASNATNFLAGINLDLPLGFATGYLKDPERDINDITSYRDEILSGKLVDISGRSIHISNLDEQPGYREYTAQGKLLYLALLETFVRNKG